MPTKRKAVKKKTARTKKNAAKDASRSRVTLGNLLGRAAWADKAGFQFGDNRDVYKVAGYVRPSDLTFNHFWTLYTRGDVAGRIVDMPSKTTWRTPPKIVEPDMGDAPTPFVEAFNMLARRMHLWRWFERVDRLAGVGRYAVLVLGIAGEDFEQKDPVVPGMVKPEDLIYLSVYHQENAKIDSWVTDDQDPRFGQPLIYDLNVSSGTANFPQTRVKLHASRVLHVAEDLLSDEVFGRPRLERALNRLYDLDKISASTGEAYWQLAVRILTAKIDPNATISDDELDDLEERMAEVVHDLRRQFFGQGVDLDWMGGEAPDPKNAMEMYMALIAAAAGIPKRILFGSEMGELASTTDQATYLGTINERQEQFAEPMIVREFINRMIAFGVLPAPSSGQYLVQWPTLFEASDKEKAEVNLLRARTAAALTPLGGDPMELVLIDDDRNIQLITRESIVTDPRLSLGGDDGDGEPA